MTKMRWDKAQWSPGRVDPTLGVVPDNHFVSFGKRVDIKAKPKPESRWGTDAVKRDPEKFKAALAKHMADPEFNNPSSSRRTKRNAGKS